MRRAQRVLSRRAQSLTELALLLTMVVTLILMMRIYMQRSIQAKYKAGADYMISEIRNEALERGINGFSDMKSQYDPYYRESNTTESKTANTTTGFPYTSINQVTNRIGYEKTGSALDAD